MIEDILAIIVLVVLFFGGLAGCIVKYFIHRHEKNKANNIRGEK